MEKVAVLPVPDCAWAITSLPWVIGKIARCWIAEGFSKSETCWKITGNEKKVPYCKRRCLEEDLPSN
jgi:hypothetical protein